jgi:hypothetical protein
MKNKVIILILISATFIYATFVNSDKNMRNKPDSDEILDSKTMAQVAIVVKDIEKASKAYAELFGIEVPEWSIASSHDSKPTKFRNERSDAEAKLAFIRLENITIELIEPLGGKSTWQEFLDNEGEGLHHIAFWIKGMKEKVELFRANGYPEIQSGGWDGGEYSYIDCTSKLGTIIELLEDHSSE